MTLTSRRVSSGTATTAAALFDEALRAAAGGTGGGLTAHYAAGSVPLPLARWCAPADDVDRAALDRLCVRLGQTAAVLDLGCGPGRHVADLHARGLRALGVDSSPVAVELAQRRGAPALRSDALGPLPGGDHGWDAVVLLDGNIGIGGDPLLLLCRVRDLLRAHGTVLLELDPHDVTDRGEAQLTSGRSASQPFPWARLGRRGLGAVSRCSGLAVVGDWTRSGRSFALLSPGPA